MSIIANKLFVDELSARLEDKITVKTMRDITAALEEQMAAYDIQRIDTDVEKKQFVDMMELFLNTKQTEGLSPRTLKHYRYVLTRYQKFDSTPIREITVFNLRNYLAHEKDRGLADKTLQNVRDAFTSFFGWLFREGLLMKNPCANLSPIKCKQEVKKPYSNVEIEKLKESCQTVRDKAMIAFFLATGCRVSEVCDLNIDDIDFNARECKVLGKGNKERIVYMDEVCVMQLENYLREHYAKESALFLNRYNHRIDPQGVRKRLHKLEEISGVPNVHPHRFRRTLATNLIDHGMPIQEVAKILGHEKIDTTMKYVYLDKRNIKNSYQKYR